MVKGHDRFKPVLAAIRQHVRIVIQRFIIEWRRRSGPVHVGWLYPAPFDAKTKRIETQLPATRKVLWITIPEISAHSGRCDVFPEFRGGPVRLRFSRPVIAPL